MDNSYGVFDETVLKAGPTPPPYQPPCIETLLIKPTIISANMQLSHAVGFYDRIKCEDMASDISGMFSRAAAQQRYEKVQLVDTLRCPTSTLGIDYRGLRSAPAQSFVPAYDVMDFVASSNSFNFLTSSENRSSSSAELGKSTATYAFTNRMGMHVHDHGEDGVKPLNMMMTSPLSSFPKDNMGQGLEPAQTSKYMGHSVTKAINVFEDSSELISNVPSDHFSPDLMIARFLDSPNSPNSPSKQDSTLSTEDLDTDWSKSQSQSSCKRRKTQQKKVVYVPTGDAKQLKGETPPSDLWAWRKYGQKPIKGSPYPRGYYRCSSSKGCSARKQVERSCTDPTMLIVTYTSDHNHAWPASKTTANSQTPPKPPHSKDGTSEDRSEEAASSSCEVVNENLFSSIINSASKIDEQVVSSLDSLHSDESLSLKRDVDLCFFSSASTTEEDGVFDDLGELPELSSIFSKGYLEDLRHTDDVAWFT